MRGLNMSYPIAVCVSMLPPAYQRNFFHEYNDNASNCNNLYIKRYIATTGVDLEGKKLRNRESIVLVDALYLHSDRWWQSVQQNNSEILRAAYLPK